ncbi:MAG: hypothetical protein ABL951_09485 [Alphaproteobacteria bacterium]
MTINSNLAGRLLAMAGAALLTVSGFTPSANAGIINMDFTSDAATIIVGATTTDASVSHDYTNSTTSTAKMGVDMTPFGYAGTLDITGTRSYIETYDAQPGPGTNMQPRTMRLTRWNGNGLAICSDQRSDGCTGSDEHTVDGNGISGHDIDESIKFAFSTGMEFAVRYVTFGYSDSNDDAVMSFMTALTSTLNINIDYHNNNSNYDYSSCSNLTSSSSSDTVVCTVDIYKLAALSDGTSLGALDLLRYDAAVDYNLGQDAIYNFLASSSGFEFKALDSNDNWKLRQVSWVVDDVPTPGTAALLLGGLSGLGWFARRHRTANA